MIPTKSEIKRLAIQSGAKSYKEAMNFFKEQEVLPVGVSLKDVFEVIKDIPSLKPKKGGTVIAPVVSKGQLQIKAFYVPTKDLSVEEAGKILDLAVDAGASANEGVEGAVQKHKYINHYKIQNWLHVGVVYEGSGFKTYLSDNKNSFNHKDSLAVELSNFTEVEKYLRSGNKPKAVGQAGVAHKHQTQKVKQKPVVSNKLLFTYATGQEFTVRGVTSAKVVVENDKTFVKYSAKRVGIEGFKTISEDVTIEVQGLIQVAYTNKDKNTQIVVFRDNKALSHVQTFDKTTPQTINL